MQRYAMEKIAIIGAGSWGTAFACLVAENARSTVLWSHSQEVAEGINEDHVNPRYVSYCTLDGSISATTDLKEALEGADGVVVVVPSAYIRSTMQAAHPYISHGTPVLILTKGVEPDTGELMCDVVADEIGNRQRIAVLSGPNHAEEICMGMISGAVVASDCEAVAQYFQQLISSKSFRVYVSDDLVGVELCAATKNIIAIATGAASKLEVGDNCIAVLMTRGLAEIGRIVSAAGGNPLTCMGLAGMGDLIATCMSEHSRNRSFGQALMDGVTVREYEEKTHMVVEGAAATKSIYALGQKLGVQIPITEAVWSMLYDNRDPRQAIDILLDRLPNEEFYDFDQDVLAERSN